MPTTANATTEAFAQEFEGTPVSPDGGTVVFQSNQGTLPGLGGTGFADRYLAARGADGWNTNLIGPSANETEMPGPGGITPQHAYYFLSAGVTCVPGEDHGSLIEDFGGGEPCTDLLRGPDGSYELLARGSLGDDPRGQGFYITPGATHVVFDTSRLKDQAIQLEPDAAPTGTIALYDRTPGGPTKVISKLPGPDGGITPAAGENAFYEGVSADGSAVAFGIGGLTPGPTLYVRKDGTTYSVTTAANTFAGISADGSYVFYANAATKKAKLQTPADLFSFDTSSQTMTQITTAGDAQFVNVSVDGSRVYFVSPTQIDGQGTAGAPNLYLWDRAGGTTTFIGTVAPGDLTGAAYSEYRFAKPSLAGWTEFAQAAEKAAQFGAGAEISRTTPDGSTIVFESAAQLTAYENAGHQEIYRYRAGDPAPSCVSCGPGSGPATANASLQSFNEGSGDHIRPLNPVNPATNLTDDGNAVFFQTGQSLVPADVNGRQDVYEWKADGSGDCAESGGCVSLISSGQAAQDSFLYAATRDGADVVFLAPQALLPEDRNGGTGALYDARVDGGFPVPPVAPPACEGDACQGGPTLSPSLPPPSSSSFSGRGNVRPGKRCVRHKRRRGRHCVRRRRRHSNRSHRRRDRRPMPLSGGWRVRR